MGLQACLKDGVPQEVCVLRVRLRCKPCMGTGVRFEDKNCCYTSLSPMISSSGSLVMYCQICLMDRKHVLVSVLYLPF